MLIRAGETYSTRDGELVKIVEVNRKNPSYPIEGIGQYDSERYLYASTGRYIVDGTYPHPKDLMSKYVKPKTRKVIKFKTITTKNGMIPYDKEATIHSVTYDELQEVYNIIYSTKETI